MSCFVEMREIGKEPQLARLKRCRETFHEETPSVTNDLEAATCEDTPPARRLFKPRQIREYLKRQVKKD